jgi:RNA polymerase sigma factor (TIGR02999 family)
MNDRTPADFSMTLSRAREGDPQAAAVIFPLVYDQLRRVAGSYLRDNASGHTLQPTALVHEAFLRLCQRDTPFNDRAHFIAVAATAMRQILIDHARRTGAQKRGGGAARVTLQDLPSSGSGEAALSPVDVLALDAALTRLAALSPRQARVIELQFFGGMTVDEVAEAMAVSKSLVEKEWRRARAWIRSELAEGADGGGEGAG